MVGLGNSCRGMKSPPLLMAALVACIIVLGFNYWIASSRSMDLQGRVMDLEGKVRRAAAERGAVEQKKNEFQGELEKQRQQIDKIQSLHSFQMENANRVHQEEKAMLMSNITLNDRLIQSLREHLKELQTEYGKLQLDVFWFQKNQTNLQRKFSYDLSQCINQMKELEEQCEERIDELRKKSTDVPQIKEKKDFTEDSQVDTQLPALKETEFKQADLEQQKTSEDVPKAVPTVRKTDLMQAKDKQEQEAVNQDKDVDYNSDVNEAESETDKQAALAGIENGKKEKKTVLNQISHAENIKIIFCMASCSKLYLANLFFELSLMFTV
ncbi:Golgi membrane protein 1 isoform 3-T5 [Cyanocitta cristata]